MSRFRLGFALLLLSSPFLRADDPLDKMKADLFYLAGEECEGRGLKTNGLNKAADLIANTFKAAGLKSAVADGSYFQPFVVKESFLAEGAQKVNLTGPDNAKLELALNKQFCVCGLTGKGTATGKLVFAGFGVSADKKYDDYAGLDVAGKVVVVMRQVPKAKVGDKPLFSDEDVQKYAPLTTKITEAVKRKAAAVIFVNDADMAGKEDRLMGFEYAQDSGITSDVPVFQVRREVVDALLKPAGKSLGDIEKTIVAEAKPQSIEITGWSATTEATIGIKELNIKNVVGVLEGNGPLANETVVLGAHYDHLGRGETGTKLRGNTEIHYGADDNASGTTGLLELARRYGANKNRQGRRLVFIAFSGEERGLLGSLYYTKHPLFPLKDTVAMLNMDMIGRVRPDEKSKQDNIFVGGVGSAKNFEQILDESNKDLNFKFDKGKSGTGPSDHTSFYLEKVPVYFFFSKDHPEYHTPKDKPETINIAGIKKIADLVEIMTNRISTTPDRPEYVAGMGGSISGGSRGGPKIGVMPGYDETDTRGMAVENVIPGGPAEKGGMKKGDRITAIAGKPVKNVQDYMKVMGGAKKGEELEFEVLREEKKVKLKVIPQ
ncbi:M28 family peptidase [Zavarzinella formosa]|uniref:M28 family peptidase n=1 Tax=Zavarzinella formosa TaxID=360055 RepID=UPI0002DA64D8|nr:M28 family peptidase [Zavarzinella formosa]